MTDPGADKNIEITECEFRLIRSLGDFDLTMFLSEINDHGWLAAKDLLPKIALALKTGKQK